MKRGYTVVWSPSAERKLGELWLDNPAIRAEITDAVNGIDAALAHAPASIGEPAPGGMRAVVRPPVSLLFVVKEDDREVRVVRIKLWDE